MWQPQTSLKWSVNVSNTSHDVRHPGTYARGKMTAQPDPLMRHSRGTRGVETMTMPTRMRDDTSRGNQNRLKIFGISLKKLDRSTSFFVAPQLMLYENRWARMA